MSASNHFSSGIGVTHRPKVIIHNRIPQVPHRKTSPVIHVALRRIVSQNTIDNDANLAISEPSFRSEPRLGLRRRSGHEEERSNTNSHGDETLDQEQPSPPSQAMDAAHVQQAIGHDRRDDHSHVARNPEPAQPQRQLAALVKVAQPQDEIRDLMRVSLMSFRRRMIVLLNPPSKAPSNARVAKNVPLPVSPA